MLRPWLHGLLIVSQLSVFRGLYSPLIEGNPSLSSVEFQALAPESLTSHSSLFTSQAVRYQVSRWIVQQTWLLRVTRFNLPGWLMTSLLRNGNGRERALFCLAVVPWLDRDSLRNDIVSLLNDSEAVVRESAAAALVHASTVHPAVRTALVDHLSDPDENVRVAIRQSLIPTATPDELLQWFQSDSANADETLSALAPYAHEKKVRDALQTFIDWPFEKRSLNTIPLAMEQLRRDASIEDLSRWLDHPHAVVRRTAAEELQRYNDTSDVQRILREHLILEKELIVQHALARSLFPVISKEELLVWSESKFSVSVQVVAVEYLARWIHEPFIQALLAAQIAPVKDPSAITERPDGFQKSLNYQASGLLARFVSADQRRAWLSIPGADQAMIEFEQPRMSKADWISFLRQNRTALLPMVLQAIEPYVNDGDVQEALDFVANNGGSFDIRSRAAELLAPHRSRAEVLSWLGDHSDREIAAVDFLSTHAFDPDVFAALFENSSPAVLERALRAVDPYAKSRRIRRAVENRLQNEFSSKLMDAVQAAWPLPILRCPVLWAALLRDGRENPDRHLRFIVQTGFLLRRVRYFNPFNTATIMADAVRYATVSPMHHVWLENLFLSSHRVFINWLHLPQLQQRLPEWRGSKRDPVSIGSLDVSLPVSQSYWVGRTLVVPDIEGPGATRYKIARTHEAEHALADEAGAWNDLYPNEAVRADVFYMNLPNVPLKRAPLEWSAARPLLVLRYHVPDEEAFLQYPPDWKPKSLNDLLTWTQRWVESLGTLARHGWGYKGLLEMFHNVLEPYDLSFIHLGSIRKISQAIRFANMRAFGYIADTSPQHMVSFGEQGPTAAQLAGVIRDQVFQIALAQTILVQSTSFESLLAETDRVKALVTLYRQIGRSMISVYGARSVSWEAQLPVRLETIAEQALMAVAKRQGSHLDNLGFNMSVFSATGLAELGETVARAVITFQLNHRVSLQCAA